MYEINFYVFLSKLWASEWFEENNCCLSGIQCPHRGAVFSYYWRHVAYPYGEEEREACNVFFVWEMLRPLLRGGSGRICFSCLTMMMMMMMMMMSLKIWTFCLLGECALWYRFQLPSIVCSKYNSNLTSCFSRDHLK